MERHFEWLLVAARLLVALAFLLNGFGIIDQAIPAREMMERGVPAGIVPFAMFTGRILEFIAGFGLALGIVPRLCALALFVFLVPATFVSHSFWLAAGTPQFQGQLISGDSGWSPVYRWNHESAFVAPSKWSTFESSAH